MCCSSRRRFQAAALGCCVHWESSICNCEDARPVSGGKHINDAVTSGTGRTGLSTSSFTNAGRERDGRRSATPVVVKTAGLWEVQGHIISRNTHTAPQSLLGEERHGQRTEIVRSRAIQITTQRNDGCSLLTDAPLGTGRKEREGQAKL